MNPKTTIKRKKIRRMVYIFEDAWQNAMQMAAQTGIPISAKVSQALENWKPENESESTAPRQKTKK